MGLLSALFGRPQTTFHYHHLHREHYKERIACARDEGEEVDRVRWVCCFCNYSSTGPIPPMTGTLVLPPEATGSLVLPAEATGSLVLPIPTMTLTGVHPTLTAEESTG